MAHLRSIMLAAVIPLAVSATTVLLLFSNLATIQAFAQSSSTDAHKPDGTKSIVILKEGQRDGPLLVKEIYSDHITGTQYRQYPLANFGTPITMYRGDTATNGCNITLTLLHTNLDKGSATFLKNVDMDEPCPL